jgi:archaellum component FlaC
MTDKSDKSKFDTAIDTVRHLTGYGLKLAIVIVLAIVAWRLAWADINVDLSKFEFSDLLAMILAIFAIGMSVAFYFKTTDSSNQFYDNIYNFTQKTSEILGRIEERFGERLKHLDEGYGRIQSQFEGIAKSPGEIEKKVEETKGKEEEVKENLQAVLKEREHLFRELSERAYQHDNERQEFMQRMEELERKRAEAESNIRDLEEDRDRLQMQLRGMERDMMEGVEGLSPRLMHRLFRHPEMRHLLMDGAPHEMIRMHSRHLIEDLPGEIKMRLRQAGIVDSEGDVTPAGVIMLRTMARRFMG